MKIAVTGASGIIGSRLCEDLEKDHEIVRIDVKGTPKPLDVADLEGLEAAIKGSQALVHLARVGGGTKAKWEDTYLNLAGTYNAFEAARRVGCSHVVIASSNHAVGQYEVLGAPGIYEPKNGTLIRADTPFRADGLYGVWKAFGEVLGRYYSDEYGLKVACLRIGGVRKDDKPDVSNLAREASWLNLTDDQKRKRMAAIWMSQRDLARLVRAILASDVPFGVAYGVSDNATRFWDLEEGRKLYGFWPLDGVR